VPAFLSRQTDLIESACKYGKVINIKKGQFLAPWDMKNVVDKCSYFGNENILLTERGSCFGYNTLVVDMTSISILSETKKPVIIDATHAVQKPGGNGKTSGGNREHALIIAKSAVAAGPLGGVFCEVHNDPDNAFSDGPNSLNFDMTTKLLPILKNLDEITKQST
jgi:2-dehydro-3-deoxyphosphooctonate aldolase (KDO 8-P synthase)